MLIGFVLNGLLIVDIAYKNRKKVSQITDLKQTILNQEELLEASSVEYENLRSFPNLDKKAKSLGLVKSEKSITIEIPVDKKTSNE